MSNIVGTTDLIHTAVLTGARRCLAIAAAGGVAAILGAMRRHAGAEAVQENACAALRNLVCSATNRPMLRSAGAEPLLRAAKKRFPSVREHCDSVLGWIKAVDHL